MRTYLLVALGGGLGANARLIIGLWCATKLGEKVTFPWGTLLINLSGSFLLGVFMAALDRLGLRDDWRMLFAVGFLGAYTTFSTFTYEALKLWQQGYAAQTIAYLLSSVIGGLICVVLGVGVGALLSEGVLSARR